MRISPLVAAWKRHGRQMRYEQETEKNVGENPGRHGLSGPPEASGRAHPLLVGQACPVYDSLSVQ